MFTGGGGPSSSGYGNGGLGLLVVSPGIGVLGGNGGGSFGVGRTGRGSTGGAVGTFALTL